MSYIESMEANQELVEALILHQGYKDPHAFLGLHSLNGERRLIRLWRPKSRECHLEVLGKIVEAKMVDPEGLFEYIHPTPLEPKDYRIYHTNGLLANDPYAFESTFQELDQYFLSKGVHYQLYDMLGSTVTEHQGIKGTKFAVWAPSALSVSLIGDFNYWDGRANPMRSTGYSGVWELFIPGLGAGEKYKYEVRSRTGSLKVKSDPVAHYSELRPKTASIVYDLSHFSWTDGDWLGKRNQYREGKSPLNIYEVHLGSWQRKEGQFLNYQELAERLAQYCREMGYTHVELMGIMEHPLDESWGYQVTGYFAPTSRFGTPTDFQSFVNYMHMQGIGVIIDWVPAHFPKDDFSLAEFDGTHLYEHSDERQRSHPHWFTNIFNYGRVEVANFLIASALFWLEKMHIDGLRVDAVASMIYLDYGREPGAWIPNAYGNNINLEALEFIKHLNSILHERFPDAMTFAEESTSYNAITRPVNRGGLGFDYKWNMGWMNDTLRYFSTDPIYRTFKQNELTFVMLYFYSERFVSVLSHDEVTHGKASLMVKMPGDDWQKFAGMRLLYSYMIGVPGKKLFFMGGELGQWNEWNCNTELDWSLLQHDRHQKLKNCIRDLNHFYLAHPALWELDFDPHGFQWVDLSDHTNSVLTYLRRSQNQTLLIVHHFTPTYLTEYRISVHRLLHAKEIFNTDSEEYGGSGKINTQVIIDSGSVTIQLAPLSTMIFEVGFAP